jgi:hypothetical protein
MSDQESITKRTNMAWRGMDLEQQIQPQILFPSKITKNATSRTKPGSKKGSGELFLIESGLGEPRD